MTEEKIKEIIQKMIDNNEPPEKIREFVKLAKAKMPKEDQTQEDATVKEEGTASTSETTSLDSLQLSPEAYSIVNSYRTADELKADIDAGKITNPEIINYVKGAGGEGPTDQELLVTSADEILKAQEELVNFKDYNKTIKYCHSTVGIAILNTSITIVFGFSILILSNFIPTIYFGVFTGIAMLLAMISVLTLLPSLLLVFKPFKIK